MAKIFDSATALKNICEPAKSDYWQNPFETEAKGGGDCEDQAIFLQHKLALAGIKSEVIIGKFFLSDSYGHAWVEVPNADFTDVYILDR